MRKLLVTLAFLFIGGLAMASNFPEVPDRDKTPGQLCTRVDPDFKELRYKEQIPVCNRNVRTSLKHKVYSSYGIPTEDQREFTIDHLIPLSLGGANYQANLWPQHNSISTAKVEAQIYQRIRKGEITQKEAIEEILRIKFKKENNNEK